MWLNYSCIKSFSWLEPLPAVYIIQWAALVSWTIWATTLAFTFYSPCYCYRFFWTSYISLLLYCSLLIDCRIVALLHWLCSQRCTCEWIWKNHAVIFLMWSPIISSTPECAQCGLTAPAKLFTALGSDLKIWTAVGFLYPWVLTSWASQHTAQCSSGN